MPKLKNKSCNSFIDNFRLLTLCSMRWQCRPSLNWRLESLPPLASRCYATEGALPVFSVTVGLRCCRSLRRWSCTFPVDAACNFHGRFIALSPLHRRSSVVPWYRTLIQLTDEDDELTR